MGDRGWCEREPALGAAMTSRSHGLSTALQAPGRFEVRSVPPTGDCFYDSMHLLLPTAERPALLCDAGCMRDAVAAAMDESTLELYRMYAEAGIEGFDWMHVGRRSDSGGISSLADLREFASRRGHESGPAQCLWADEFALTTIARLASVAILIFDEQAVSRGNRSGRRRGSELDAVDGRFVAVGGPSNRCVLLHRSRRQHYSPIFFDACGVVEITSLPSATRELWPRSDALTGAGRGAGSGGRESDPDGDGGSKRRRREATDALSGHEARSASAAGQIACAACTFLNSALLMRCEICDEPLAV